MLDLAQAVLMASCGPLAVAAILRALRVEPRRRLWLGLLLSAWFLLTALTTIPSVGRVPGALFGIVLPVLAASAYLVFSPSARQMIERANVPILVLLHVTRLSGGLFILLAAEGRLSNPFAVIAGWGDIIAAMTALPAAIIAWRARPGWEKWVLVWNVFGVLDFVVAVGLGITSQPGSPLRLFFEEPGTAILGQLPWRFIPSFFVPLYVTIHVALFIRLVPGVFGRRSAKDVQPQAA
jgi:hypothetical protein